MRRTGRTTRIIDHVVDRLLAGELVIAHDHSDYKHTAHSLSEFVNRIKERFDQNPQRHFMQIKASPPGYFSEGEHKIYYVLLKLTAINN